MLVSLLRWPWIKHVEQKNLKLRTIDTEWRKHKKTKKQNAERGIPHWTK